MPPDVVELQLPEFLPQHCSPLITYGYTPGEEVAPTKWKTSEPAMLEEGGIHLWGYLLGAPCTGSLCMEEASWKQLNQTTELSPIHSFIINN